MPASRRPIVLATRGSALALAQTNLILARCQAAFPEFQFEAKIIKTTGDKMQTIALDNPNQAVTRGLFTKELEVALLNGEADLAVHSLKDLPTELPEGLTLGAVTERADARDVLIYRNADFFQEHAPKRGFRPHTRLQEFPSGATIATSSTRRLAQLLGLRPDLKIVPIRGNVGTRLQKLCDQPELDGLVLAAAGLERLRFRIFPDGRLTAEEAGAAPEGLLAVHLSIDEMLPCVGQAALGIEIRAGDEGIARICGALNDAATHHCVTAERAFLQAMGGGCLSPVAAYAQISDGELRVRAVSFRNEQFRRAEKAGSPEEAERIGVELAKMISD